MNIKKSKKGQVGLNSVVPIALTALFIGVIALVLINVRSDSSITTNDAAYNAISDGLTMITNVTGKLGLLGTMIGLGLVVVAALLFFGGRRQKGGGFGV